MPDPIRVGVVRSDVPSCQYYRAGFAAEALAAEGAIEYIELGDQPLRVRYAARRNGPQQPVGLVEAPEVDVVIFVRGVFPERMHDIIHFLQVDHGIACVVDFDDAYDRLPPILQNLYKINPTTNPYFNWQHAIDAAKLADGVTVSTPALLRYRRDAHVLRNAIPEKWLKISRQTSGRIGWTGTIAGHPGDLRQCGAGVQLAVDETGYAFRVIGDGIGVKRELGLVQDPESTGIVDFANYPLAVAQLDVGIAPLVLDDYRKNAKSWLKPLEYLAAGAQYVASPSTEYKLLQAELEQWCAKNDSPPLGAIAKPRSRDWRRACVAALRRAEDAPDEVSHAARRFVREHHLVERLADRWLLAWTEALNRRRNS